MACGPLDENIPIQIPGGVPTPGFQCVELSERFLYITHGWTGIGAYGGERDTNGAEVAKHYAAAHSVPLIANGTPGVSPQVGDVISFSTTSTFTDTGHTGVVVASNVNSEGNGSIELLSENFNHTGDLKPLAVSHWQVASIGFAHTEWIQSGTGGSGKSQLPGPGLYGSFNRYDGGPKGHYETVGAQPAGFSFEGSLGDILMVQVPGTEPWFSCRAGTDEFTSRSSTCEGQELIGFEGYAYTSQPANVPTVPVYRCHTNGPVTHFDSHDPNCEGQTSDGLLGYLLASAGGAFARVPVAETLAASAQSPISANLSGAVDPEGFPLSACRFEYGPTTAYGSTASCSPAPGQGEAAEQVSATVSGLSPASEYHFRVVAVGPGGTAYGGDKTFTTLALTAPESTTSSASQNGGATSGPTPSHSVLAGKTRRSASRVSRALAKCRKIKDRRRRTKCELRVRKRDHKHVRRVKR
jgi:hypothetical protein